MTQMATLTVDVQANKVIARLTVHNPSAHDPLFVEKMKVFLDLPLQIDLFLVTLDGKEIAYTGAMAKRKAPGPEDFLRIAPDADLRAVADITDLYAFVPGTHTYTIQYRAFHADPNDETHLVKIESNLATFTLSR